MSLILFLKKGFNIRITLINIELKMNYDAM